MRTSIFRGVVAAAAVWAMTGVAGAGVLQAYEVIVPGSSNIFGAGQAVAPDPDGGGGGTLPPTVVLPAVQSGAYFSIAAAFGEVSCCGTGEGNFNGPDGGSFASGNTDVTSFNGISGLIHNGRTMFLVGVFLGDSAPADPAPDRLDFSGGADNEHEYFPLLNQSFFIGDGQVNEAGTARHEESQKFYLPAGATRLALGFVDAFEFGNPSSPPGFYNDNFGELTVVLGVVPAPGTAGLIGAAGLVAVRRRRA